MKTKIILFIMLTTSALSFAQDLGIQNMTFKNSDVEQKSFNITSINSFSHILKISGKPISKLKLTISASDFADKKTDQIIKNNEVDLAKIVKDIYEEYNTDQRKNKLTIKLTFEEKYSILELTYNIIANADKPKNSESTTYEYISTIDNYTSLDLCNNSLSKSEICVEEQKSVLPTPKCNKVIIYDLKTNGLTGQYKNKIIISSKSINVGNSVQIHVKNLNPYRYKISLNAKDSLFPVEEPALFKSVFDYSTVIGNINSAVSATNASSTQKKEITNKDYDSAVNDLINFQGKLTLFETDLQNAVNAIIKNPDFIDSTQLANLPKQIRECIITNFLPNINITLYNMESELQKEFIKRIFKIRMIFLSLSSDEQAEQKEFYDNLVSDSSNQALTNSVLLIKIIKTVRTDVVYSIPKISESDELFITIDVSPLEQIQQPVSTTEKTTSVLQKNTPKINIFPTQRVRSDQFPVPVFGGFKIDFSTGLFFSGLKNDTYTLQQDSITGLGSTGQDSTLARGSYVVKEKESKFDMGIGAFAHGYTRLLRGVDLAATIGGGINFDKQLRYMTGLTLLFGNHNKLAIGGGIAFGKVEKMSNSLESAYTNQSLVPSSITSVETVSVFTNSWYLSATYSFRIGK